MEWIDALNLALAYVEEHLEDDLSLRRIAEAAHYAPWTLERIFSALTETTISEYVRSRRLSVAGQRLREPGARVIDVALRYGYETPESFQKAFRRFHGIAPSEARRAGAALKYCNPLKLQINLTGGTIMEYVLEDIGALTILGMERRFAVDTVFTEIPKFWNEYGAKGLHCVTPGYLGVCFDTCGQAEFSYWIASFCDADAPVPEGFAKRVIPAQTWAKFRAVGPIPGALQRLNRRIYTEWLPAQTEYALAEGTNIEMYTHGDMDADDYVSEIWIPVVKKSAK